MPLVDATVGKAALAIGATLAFHSELMQAAILEQVFVGHRARIVFMQQPLLDQVVKKYLSGSGFNGLSARDAEGRLGITRKTLVKRVLPLVEDGDANLVFGDAHPNPHVLALPPEPLADQAAKLLSELGETSNFCIYPAPTRLRSVVKKGRYEGRPFTLELALGRAQLEFEAFDLAVLESYRNDPRYYYKCSDFKGMISVSGEDSPLAERDQILLESFGFAYDERMRRAVAAFLRYLARLSPEHQQIWAARRLEGDFTLHPHYYQTSRGVWATGRSVFVAILEEIGRIVEACKAAGENPLFRSTFEEQRPVTFGFLLRPTTKEFHDFVHDLDKMMSENLDRGFFAGKVSLEEEQKRSDGRVRVIDRGSLQLLQEWLGLASGHPDRAESVVGVLKEIRKIRQRPAHSLEDNRFDESFLGQQRDILVRVLKSLISIRQVLVTLPGAGALAGKWADGREVYVY